MKPIIICNLFYLKLIILKILLVKKKIFDFEQVEKLLYFVMEGVAKTNEVLFFFSFAGPPHHWGAPAGPVKWITPQLR